MVLVGLVAGQPVIIHISTILQSGHILADLALYTLTKEGYPRETRPRKFLGSWL